MSLFYQLNICRNCINFPFLSVRFIVCVLFCFCCSVSSRIYWIYVILSRINFKDLFGLLLFHIYLFYFTYSLIFFISFSLLSLWMNRFDLIKLFCKSASCQISLPESGFSHLYLCWNEMFTFVFIFPFCFVFGYSW